MVPSIVCLYQGVTTVKSDWLDTGANKAPFMPSMHYVISGSASFCEKGEMHRLEPGHLYFFPMNRTRQFFLEENEVYRHWYVNFSIVPVPLEESVLELPIPKNSPEKTMLDALIKFAEEKLPDDLYEPAIVSFLSVILTKNNVRFSPDERLSVILQTIGENYHRHLTVSELAAQVHLAPRYFISYFTKAMTETPYQYILKYRINIAEKLLSSGVTITEAAYRTGFSGIYAFSAAYKKIRGYPPREYTGADKTDAKLPDMYKMSKDE